MAVPELLAARHTPRPAGQGASFAYASRFRVVIVVEVPSYAVPCLCRAGRSGLAGNAAQPFDADGTVHEDPDISMGLNDLDPCSRLGRDATKLSCVSDPHGQHMTTTVASRHAKSGVETPSRARAHTGESGATPGAAFTTSPCHFPFHQPSRPCRASEADQLHRAGAHQEPAALLHHRGQTSVGA